jgi:hypothetical protein
MLLDEKRIQRVHEGVVDSQRQLLAKDHPFEMRLRRATGPEHFKTIKTRGDRWWFVTPDGNGFLSADVNHVDYREDYSDSFVDSVAGKLRNWGFNTIGSTVRHSAATEQRRASRETPSAAAVLPTDGSSPSVACC